MCRPTVGNFLNVASKGTIARRLSRNGRLARRQMAPLPVRLRYLQASQDPRYRLPSVNQGQSVSSGISMPLATICLATICLATICPGHEMLSKLHGCKLLALSIRINQVICKGGLQLCEISSPPLAHRWLRVLTVSLVHLSTQGTAMNQSPSGQEAP
jgi:hypothetical protein